MKWKYQTSGSVIIPFAGDIDNDGASEIVALSDKVYVLNSAGELKYSYSGSGKAYVADLGTDGRKEVILGSGASVSALATTIVQLPDLTLSPSDISFSNPNPAVEETVTITATIHNIGNADATDVVVQFFDGDPDNAGTQIGDDQTIASINAGGTGTAQVDWTATSGSHDIYVIVDPYDDILESDESNNEAHTEVNVIDPGPTNFALIIVPHGWDGSSEYSAYLPAKLRNSGFEPIHIKNDVKGNNIEVNIPDLLDRLDSNPFALIHYMGHGQKNTNYLAVESFETQIEANQRHLDLTTQNGYVGIASGKLKRPGALGQVFGYYVGVTTETLENHVSHSAQPQCLIYFEGCDHGTNGVLCNAFINHLGAGAVVGYNDNVCAGPVGPFCRTVRETSEDLYKHLLDEQMNVGQAIATIRADNGLPCADPCLPMTPCIGWADFVPYYGNPDLRLISPQRARTMTIGGMSPVDLIVTSPSGKVIQKGDPEYREIDINFDNDPDDIVHIPDREMGVYSIEVIPQGSGGDYRIVVANPGCPVISFTGNTAQIPTQPYIIESTGEGIIQIISAVIPATVRIEPETLNLASQGVSTAFIQLPEGYDAADIDVSTVVCEGAPAVRGMVSEEDNGTYITKFNRQDLVDVPTGDEVELTVIGKVFYNGGYADFEGSDTVRVIDKGKGE